MNRRHTEKEQLQNELAALQKQHKKTQEQHQQGLDHLHSLQTEWDNTKRTYEQSIEEANDALSAKEMECEQMKQQYEETAVQKDALHQATLTEITERMQQMKLDFKSNTEKQLQTSEAERLRMQKAHVEDVERLQHAIIQDNLSPHMSSCHRGTPSRIGWIKKYIT